MVNMVNTAVNNNIYAGRKSGSKYNQSKAFQQKEVLETPDVAAVNKYANVQEIYEALKCNVSYRVDKQEQDEIAEKEIQNEEPEISNDSSEKMTAWYQGVPLEEWALTDPKYTDSETGISWYIRDGKYPYMVGEDAEKFRKLCEESGEFALKKFAEMTGLIQKLDDNTVAMWVITELQLNLKMGKRCLWTHQAYHMILLWICSEICLEMGIFSAISIGQTIYRKHRLGADDTLYCKSVYAWTPIGESRLVLIDRRIIDNNISCRSCMFCDYVFYNKAKW